MPFGGPTVAVMTDYHVRNEDLNGSGYAREVKENESLTSFKVLTQVSTGEPQKNFVSFSHKGDGVHENQMEILGY